MQLHRLGDQLDQHHNAPFSIGHLTHRFQPRKCPVDDYYPFTCGKQPLRLCLMGISVNAADAR